MSTLRFTSLEELGRHFGYAPAPGETPGQRFPDPDSSTPLVPFVADPPTAWKPGPSLEIALAHPGNGDTGPHVLTAETHTCAPAALPDLGILLEDLTVAQGRLEQVREQDRQARLDATQLLEAHDRAVEWAEATALALIKARCLLEQARELFQAAFTPEAKTAAAGVLHNAHSLLESAQEHHRQAIGGVKDRLLNPMLQILLTERAEHLEREQEEAAEAARLQRLTDGLAEITQQAQARRFEAARRLLETLGRAYPGDNRLLTLKTRIAHQELFVTYQAASADLWRVRKTLRKEPEGAISLLQIHDPSRLAAYDRTGAGQIFGEWKRNCRNACRKDGLTGALSYSPTFGKGAILLACSDDPTRVEVRYAIGLDGWTRGRQFVRAALLDLRPLFPR